MLSDAGWDKVVATAPGHVEAVRTYVFDQLSRTQTHQLADIGRRITQAVDPSCAPGPQSSRGRG